MDQPTDMTAPGLIAPTVPVDQPSTNPMTQELRQQAKQNLWGIDKGINDGQYVAPEDDGKRPPGGIILPDGKNSI